MQFGTTGGLAGALGNFGGGFVGVGLISGNGIFWNTQGNTFAAASVGGRLSFDSVNQVRSNSDGGFSVRNLAGTLSGKLEARTITTTAADHGAAQSTLILSPFNGIVTMGNSTLSFGSGVGGFVASQNVGFLFSQWTNNSVNGHEFGLYRTATNTASLATTQAASTLCNLNLANLTASGLITINGLGASATGTKELDFQSDGVSNITILKVATATNHTAPYRLLFTLDGGTTGASLAWSSQFSALTIRNPANNADGSFRAFEFQATRGVTATDYLTTSDVEIARAAWRGTGRAITLINSAGIHWSSTSSISGTPDIALTRGGVGLLNSTAVITSPFRSLSANPTTLDIASGLEQLVKNTTSGELRRWCNDGGSMKSILYA